jgi:hypothetical protein
MRSQHEEDEISGSLLKSDRIPAVLALSALLGPLPLVGSNNPRTIPPIAHRHTADPVSKVRPGAKVPKAKTLTAFPGEPGKRAPGRGRAID